MVTDHVGRDRSGHAVLQPSASEALMSVFSCTFALLWYSSARVLRTPLLVVAIALAIATAPTCKAVDYADGSYQVFVATNNGTVALKVTEQTDVSDLKRQLFFRIGWPMEYQRILFGRKQLRDETTLGAAQVGKGATLHLVGRLRGGMERGVGEQSREEVLRARRMHDDEPSEDELPSVEEMIADDEEIIEEERGNFEALLNGISTAWNTVALNENRVPDIGLYTDTATGKRLAPAPKTTTSAGNVLAISWPCGRGKSYVYREYMKRSLQAHPTQRFLLLSANIGYGRNLTSELRSALPNVSVGFYKTDSNLEACQIVVCSFESIQLVANQHFDDVLIDEVRSVARLIGGKTLPLENVTDLRRICFAAPRLTICDADIFFKSNESEDTTLVDDFLQEVAPERDVLCFDTTHEGPAYLKRRVRLLFGSKGEDEWFTELKRAVAEWHETRNTDSPKRVAIVVGTLGQRRTVCNLLKKIKVPFLHYDGESNGPDKIALSDPDAAWANIGVVVCTTTLSIGVDPKTTTFGRVFLWSNNSGCMPLAQMQAVFRFNRFECPGFNPEICALLDCADPVQRAKDVKAKRKRPITQPTFQEAVEEVRSTRSRRTRLLGEEESAGAGRRRGMESMEFVSDKLLRIMAHNQLEARMRTQDHYTMWERVFAHHKVEIVNGPQYASPLHYDFEAQPDVPTVNETEDREFGALKSKLEQYEWVVAHINERGEAGFRDKKAPCYGYDLKNKSGLLTTMQQQLVDVYFLVYHMDRMPCGDDLGNEEEDSEDSEERKVAKVLVKMSEDSIKDGLHLNAYMRCVRTKDQLRFDDAVRGDDEIKTRNAMLCVAMGTRMACMERAAKLLGVDSLIDGCEIPASVLETANAQIIGGNDEATVARNAAFIAQLRQLANDVCTGNNTKESRVAPLLKRLAAGCGLELLSEKDKDSREAAKAANRPRKHLFTRMRFVRRLPSIVNDWLVPSSRLQAKVCVVDWARLHAPLDADDMEADFAEDEDLADQVAPYKGPRSAAITEWYDGKAAKDKLHQLQLVDESNIHDEKALKYHRRCKSFLQTLICDGEQRISANGTQRNHVSYGKVSESIGRRTASYPSQQQCPSSLRPMLVGRWVHDIDIVNCHPTLMLQVIVNATGLSDSVPTLQEIVNDREKVLNSIAEFYGTTRDNAKWCVLRIMNGGTLQQWIKDAQCPRNQTEQQDDLRNLIDEMVKVRDAFFNLEGLKDRVVQLKAQIQTKRKADAESAQLRYERAQPQDREKLLRLAKRAQSKARFPNVERSAFSYCLGEVEDKVLAVIEHSMHTSGFETTSRIFDGLHVRHRATDTKDANDKWTEVEAALRKAEEAVKAELRYTIELVEKPLYKHTPTAAEQAIANAAANMADGV